MKVIVPPLKSQGIKTKLTAWIHSVVPKSQNRWIEPFFGTGVVGINANFSKAIFNDINPHIIAFYRSIQNGDITPETIREYLVFEGEKLRSAGDSGYDHYRLVRDRFNKSHKPLDFLFLNRAGFNGMMRFSKNGWNIPFCKKPNRFDQSYRTKIANQVANVVKVMKPGWQFHNLDFRQIIEQAEKGDIIYCDPPYHGRHTDYFNKWSEKDEETLFELLSRTKASFILSTWHHSAYRVNESIAKYWSQFHMLTKNHFYHAGGKEENRREIVEALITNFTPNLLQMQSAEAALQDQPLLV